MEKRPRASPRSRQQCRSGSASLEKENATRRGVPRNEAAAQLREALGAAGAGKGRGGPPLSQVVAQAHGARGVLSVANPALNLGRLSNLVKATRAAPYSNALTISSHIFLASPNSIIVL